jgi:hypothetical protein
MTWYLCIRVTWLLLESFTYFHWTHLFTCILTYWKTCKIVIYFSVHSHFYLKYLNLILTYQVHMFIKKNHNINMKTLLKIVFLTVCLCILLALYQCFGGTCCFHANQSSTYSMGSSWAGHGSLLFTPWKNRRKFSPRTRLPLVSTFLSGSL